MTNPTKTILAASLSAVLLGGGWAAGSRASSHDAAMPGMDHGAMPGMAETGEGQTEATTGYIAAMQGMRGMTAVDYTGDVNVDFARNMIPHHQGAIDMARVMLDHGDAPELRSLAEEIIAAQEREIAFLEQWLAENGG